MKKGSKFIKEENKKTPDSEKLPGVLLGVLSFQSPIVYSMEKYRESDL